MTELISLIVSTYNRPDALGTVLRSLARQTDRNFEIVVADDGSGPQTREVIKDWISKIGVPLKHVWQDDRVLITPHVSGGTDFAQHRGIELFCDNLRAYLAGRPLANVIPFFSLTWVWLIPSS